MTAAAGAPEHTPGRVPLAVDLAGRRVLCVGAGPVAAAKLAPLLDAGAAVEVVAPDAGEAIAAAAADGRLRWTRRGYDPADLAGAFLVVAATADAGVNDAVAADCEAAATLCVRAGAGDAAGSVALVAALRRGPVTFTVSTDGAAPALARRLRVDLAERYGPEVGDLATLLGRLRRDPDVRAALAPLDDDERRRRWHAVLDGACAAALRDGRPDDAERRAREVLAEPMAGDPLPGSLGG